MLFRSNGTGLGLYLSKKLMNEMEGDITVKSVYKKGSKFIIHLPLESQRHIARIQTIKHTIESTEIINPVSNCDCIKILAVDDNDANIMVIKGLLKILKKSCDVAKNGIEALEIVISLSRL